MRAFTWIVSMFTIFGISISNAFQFWSQSTDLRKGAMALSIVGAIVLSFTDIREWLKNRARRYRNDASINRYMMTLLKRGGAAYIFACNLSWVTTEIRQFLIEQVRNHQVIRFYVPQHNDLTRELMQRGVQVTTYEGLGYHPEARFTLINPDEPGSSLLAVGKGTKPRFFIEEFTDTDHARMSDWN